MDVTFWETKSFIHSSKSSLQEENDSEVEMLTPHHHQESWSPFLLPSHSDGEKERVCWEREEREKESVEREQPNISGQ